MTDEGEGAKAVRIAKNESGADRLQRARSLGFSGPWYHGTERLDRLLHKKGLDPKRATSGPMPYFTDNPEIASNYAKGKADTSRAVADEGDVSSYFKVHPKHLGWSGRSGIPVERTWMFLPREKREEITKNIGRVGYERPDEQEGKIVLHPEGTFGSLSSQQHVDDMLREHRGNALSVIRDLWHDSGHLFGNEDQLAHVYKTAGYPHPIDQSDAPWTTAHGVLPAMLRMRNPLDASNHKEILEKVVPHLEAAFKRDRTRAKRESHGVDMWDKNTRYTPKEWTEQLKKDIAGGENSFAWTSIPDKVTEELKRLGYDGVLDRGSKTGNPGDTAAGHNVAIPFHPHQVRSTMAKFDPEHLDKPDLSRATGGRVNTAPTEAQKEAGNYRKGHVWVQGLDISIENPKGSKRSGVDPSGKAWSCTLPADYGYIRGTEGADGDHLDVYLGPDRSSPVVFVVNQRDHRNGRFDEHKAMVGYRSERDALRDYCAAFSDGKGHLRAGSVETMSMDAFKRWLKDGATKKPAKAAPIIERALRVATLRSR